MDTRTPYQCEIDTLLDEAVDLRQKALDEIGRMWALIRTQSLIVDTLLERRAHPVPPFADCPAGVREPL